jgi:type VI secretion system protein ImpA
MNPIKQLLSAFAGPASNADSSAVGVAAELLKPVSEAFPCGESLEYDGEFAVLRARLEPKADVQYGQFSSKPDAPDWAEVERDARRLLLRSKDISVLLWLARARCRVAGAAGLLEGLRSLQAVLQAYPEQVHPQLMLDGMADPAVRANALAALCDPDGLLDDLRDVVVCGNTAFRLTVRDVERAFATPRQPYAPEPGSVKRQLADLHAKGDGVLHALLACGNCVLGIDHWSKASLKDDAPELGPLMRLLASLASFAAASPLKERVQAESVISDGIAKRVAPGSQEHALVPAGSADGGWGDGSHARLPVALMHADVQKEREQMRALLLEIRLWLEHHEPSSPITILLKQADRMWGKRFSEVAHMIPPDLMQAWDRED